MAATASGLHKEQNHLWKCAFIATGARCLEAECFCLRFSPTKVCFVSITFARGVPHVPEPAVVHSTVSLRVPTSRVEHFPGCNPTVRICKVLEAVC